MQLPVGELDMLPERKSISELTRENRPLAHYLTALYCARGPQFPDCFTARRKA